MADEKIPPAASPVPAPAQSRKLTTEDLSDLNEGDGLENALDFFRENATAIIVGAVIAAAIFAGVTLYRNHKHTVAQQASAQLFESRSSQQVQAVIDQYPGVPTVPVALLSLASSLYSEGQYDLAAHQYATFLERYPESELKAAAELGQAQCMEASGRMDEALNAYGIFADKYKDHYLAPAAIFGRARTLEQLAKFDDARAIYEDFIAANPSNAWSSRAEAALLFVDKEKRQSKLPVVPVTNNLIQLNLPPAG